MRSEAREVGCEVWFKGLEEGRNLDQVLSGIPQSQKVVEVHTLSQRGVSWTHPSVCAVCSAGTRCRHTKLMTRLPESSRM